MPQWGRSTGTARPAPSTVMNDIPARPDRATLRVVTWNLWNRDLQVGARIDAVGAVLERADADVVLCQEDIPLGGGDSFARQVAARCGLLHVFAEDPAAVTDRSGLAILSRHPLRTTVTLDLPHETDPQREPWVARRRGALLAELDVPAAGTARRVAVACAHLPWGGRHEGWRTRQLATISAEFDTRYGNEHGRDPGDGVLGVLGMDANAVADGRAVRFLTGKDPYGNQEAYWTDAWAAARVRHDDGSGAGITSSAANPWAHTTAEDIGIARPDLLPERRIDYVFVRGYAHGRRGTPLQAAVLGREPAGSGQVLPSDHYAVLADLLL